MWLGERREGEEVPEHVAKEIDALDAALRGERAAEGDEALGALVTALREERSAPDPEFARALDEWAAAGFPRRPQPRLSERATRGDLAGRARALAASLTPRRLAPVGAAVAGLVVVVVAVSQVELDGGGGGDGANQDGAGSGPAIQAEGEAGEAVPDVTEDAVPRQPEVAALDARRGGAEASRSFEALDRDFVAPPIPNAPGPAGGHEVRRVERDAQLTLAAPADEVQDVTNQAVDLVERYRGIVLSARSSGTEESASATLDLVIPTRNLDAALDGLSDLADVKSLSEGSLDITRPFVDAKDRLAGLRAERKSLIAQIRAADDEAELDRLKTRLAAVNEQIAQANAEFEAVQRRARHAQVTLQITSEGADEGEWSFDEALDDAGRVLTVAAGVILISGAVLLPLAIVAALAYLVLAAARRRARERALDE